MLPDSLLQNMIYAAFGNGSGAVAFPVVRLTFVTMI